MGEKLVRRGLVHSCVGNLSVREGEGCIITATGAMLDELSDDALVTVSFADCPLTATASSDAPLHLAIYRETEAGAIVHTHSPYAVAESLISAQPLLISSDIECAGVLGGIPVVDASDDRAETISRCLNALHGHPALVIRGHGVVAIGRSIDEAFSMASFAEHACRVRYLTRFEVRGNSPRQ
ncbi:MAG: class II aldolase/adducin family protein [Candidatus Eisenbacteria bacterium]|nr:class II aldolase/adducin family protein [Candidatus Eisenbacteria bacterium]